MNDEAFHFILGLWNWILNIGYCILLSFYPSFQLTFICINLLIYYYSFLIISAFPAVLPFNKENGRKSAEFLNFCQNSCILF